MLRRSIPLLLLSLVALPLFALDPGRAEGVLTTDSVKTPLAYAYMARKVHNETSGKNDATKIVLTDKALPEGTNIRNLDYEFPEGIYGIVVCLDREQQPVHVVVQHPSGVYDGGWLQAEPNVTVRARQVDGALEGHMRCRSVERPSVTYSFEADFAASGQ